VFFPASTAKRLSRSPECFQKGRPKNNPFYGEALTRFENLGPGLCAHGAPGKKPRSSFRAGATAEQSPQPRPLLEMAKIEFARAELMCQHGSITAVFTEYSRTGRREFVGWAVQLARALKNQ